MGACPGPGCANWGFATIWVERPLGAGRSTVSRLEMRPIAWSRNVKGQALQIVVPTVDPAWFDSDALRRAAVARHGTAGQDCPECGDWRWMPLSSKQLPPVRSSKRWDDYELVASPD